MALTDGHVLAERDAALGGIHELLGAQAVVEVGSDLIQPLRHALAVVDGTQAELLLALGLEVPSLLGSYLQVAVTLVVLGVLIVALTLRDVLVLLLGVRELHGRG